MYNPNSVPDGPHYFYIFQDQTKPWFKLGISRNPDFRRKKLCWEIYGRHSLGNIVKYRSWAFRNYFGSLYVEQAAIGMMKNFGFVEVRTPDWFEVDQQTMDALIVSIGELAEAITNWEDMNAATECDACREEKPYGAYLYDSRFLPLDQWYEVAPGRWEPSGTTLEQRVAHELKTYERRNKKIPEGVARLIATINPDKIPTSKS
jgi:hypothetical protein